jgi:hypothetical protein
MHFLSTRWLGRPPRLGSGAVGTLTADRPVGHTPGTSSRAPASSPRAFVLCPHGGTSSFDYFRSPVIKGDYRFTVYIVKIRLPLYFLLID